MVLSHSIRSFGVMSSSCFGGDLVSPIRSCHTSLVAGVVVLVCRLVSVDGVPFVMSVTPAFS